MKALLIAGGLGTRLRPLTHTRPKHLLPIGNKAHIDHVIDLLVAHDIRSVVLLTSYLAERFEKVIDGAQKRGVTVEVAHEAEPLGTAGAIKNAEPLLADETFFAFNGDVLTSTDLTAVLATHRASSATGTIVLTPVEDPSAFGVVETEASGRVTRFVEKPPPGTVDTNLINAGIYVFEPEVLGHIPPGRVVSIERDVFPGLAGAGHLYATPTSGYWMDIGTPDKYLQANLDVASGRFPAVGVAPEAGAIVDATAKIDPSAQVSSACIGAGCLIGAGARIVESVLLDGVEVGPGATIERCCLGEGVRVAPGAHVSGLTAGDSETIET